MISIGIHTCVKRNVTVLFPNKLYVLGDWFQFVHVNKRTFSSNILLLEHSFPFRLFIFLSSHRDDGQMERK